MQKQDAGLKPLRFRSIISVTDQQQPRAVVTGTIGMVVPTFEKLNFCWLIEHVTNHLDSLGQTVLIATNQYDIDREVQAVKAFCRTWC